MASTSIFKTKRLFILCVFCVVCFAIWIDVRSILFRTDPPSFDDAQQVEENSDLHLKIYQVRGHNATVLRHYSDARYKAINAMSNFGQTGRRYAVESTSLPEKNTTREILRDKNDSMAKYHNNTEQVEHRDNITMGKIILFWTTYFNGDPFEPPYMNEGQRNCRDTQCYLTSNKALLSEASALIFHNIDAPNFPNIRYPHQLYVHYSMEPPYHDSSYLDEYEDQLNLTVNYRRDADIHKPYEYYGKVSGEETFQYKPLIPFKNKTRSVVWMASHCVTESRREQYVAELRKYIDVDVFGTCGNASCPRTSGYSHCMHKVENKYRFYLAFENNICPFYHTEKLTNAMDVELIPVVLGMSNYSQENSVFPPYSVIDVRNFASPKHLADYLNFLSHNEKEYYEYFEWKGKNYQKVTKNWYCELCGILHSDRYLRGDRIVPSYKRFGGYRRWWRDGCDNDLVTRMRERGGW